MTTVYAGRLSQTLTLSVLGNQLSSCQITSMQGTVLSVINHHDCGW